MTEMDNPYTLELSTRAMRDLVDSAMARIVELIESLPDQPVDTSPRADRAFLHSLVEPLPHGSSPIEDLLKMVFDGARSFGLNPISPGFMGYVPGGGIFHAAVADLIADTINQYVGVAAVAPMLSQLEANVIRWFGEIVGLPTTARGYLTSGGSLATLGAVVTARHVMLGRTFDNAVIYASDQVHHCIEKAAFVAGFDKASVKRLPADESYRLNPESVVQAIREDRADGRHPFMVVGCAGTTNTGAVDPLSDLRAVADREGLWFHVDAAYGGFFCLTDRGRDTLRGIEMADSVVLDPHKTLFLPYGTGCLLVRRGSNLRSTFRMSADYLPDMQGDEDEALWDFAEMSPELTRPFRALRVWLPLKMHGAAVFARYLDEKLDLAQWVQSQIARMDGLEILAPAELSILAFAVSKRGLTRAERNARTRQLLARINSKNRVHLTGTVIKNVFAIRIAVVAYRTHFDHMKRLLEDLNASLSELGIPSSMSSG